MSAGKIFKSLLLAFFAAFLIVPFAVTAQSHVDSEPELYIEELDRDLQRVDEARLDRVLDAYEADDALQRERPEWEAEIEEIEPRSDSWLDPVFDAIAGFFRFIGPALGYLLIALIAMAILYGLYLVFGESIALRWGQKEKAAAPDVSVVPDLRPEHGRATALLEDADALAAQGRFAEAVHLLLFRSIDDIQEKHSGVVGRSLTSREIGALNILPDSIRDALSPIIRIVERSFFGGRDVDEAGWLQARSSYETFAFGGTW